APVAEPGDTAGLLGFEGALLPTQLDGDGLAAREPPQRAALALDEEHRAVGRQREATQVGERRALARLPCPQELHLRCLRRGGGGSGKRRHHSERKSRGRGFLPRIGKHGDPPLNVKKILAPGRIARTVGAALTLLAIALLWVEVPLLELVELKTYDMRLRALEQAPVRHVTIAAIDERSLARIGRWPWSRSTLAELARRLDEAGARVIAFDLFFPEHESPGADAQFARALGDSRKAVLGTVFLLEREDAQYIGARTLRAAMQAIAPQAIDAVRTSGDAAQPPAL